MELSASREAECSVLDDDARARFQCVCGAKRLKFLCFWGIYFPESIL